ncbi:hypothetical protein BT96DRAFT_1015563, partial [Gymnopus androsaceus JB14]
MSNGTFHPQGYTPSSSQPDGRDGQQSSGLSGSRTQQGNRDHRVARNRALAELRNSLQGFVDDFQQSKRNQKDTDAQFCLRSRFQYDPNVLQPFFSQLERTQREAEQRGSGTRSRSMTTLPTARKKTNTISVENSQRRKRWSGLRRMMTSTIQNPPLLNACPPPPNAIEPRPQKGPKTSPSTY